MATKSKEPMRVEGSGPVAAEVVATRMEFGALVAMGGSIRDRSYRVGDWVRIIECGPDGEPTGRVEILEVARVTDHRAVLHGCQWLRQRTDEPPTPPLIRETGPQ